MPESSSYEERRADSRFGLSTTTSGALLAAVPLPSLALAYGPSASAAQVVQWISVAAASAALFLAALTVGSVPFLGRVLATLGLAITTGLLLPLWMRSPSAALLMLLASTVGLSLLWKTNVATTLLGRSRETERGGGQLRGAVLTSLLAWLLWVMAGAGSEPFESGPVLWAALIGLGFGILRALVRLRREPKKSLGLLTLCAMSLFIAWRCGASSFWGVSTLVGSASAMGLALRRPKAARLEGGTFWETLLGHPERLFVGTFAALSLGGGLLLALPAAGAKGALSGIDALFTATSAVCVTGLITVDTPVDLSFFGQAIVLVLIQIGGLGIMTFSTAVLWALGRRMSLRHEGAVASLISTRDRGRLFRTAKHILVFTGISEVLGAALLSATFLLGGESFKMALWRGVFTSISAFCNAGFALQSDSLIPYQSSPLVLHTVSALIILGGISPLAVFALPQLAKRSMEPVAIQAKIAWASAGVLLTFGFFYFLAFEWERSLGGLSLVDKLNNAWFQSVTLRTAGFNSVDLTVVQPATLTLMLIWMFVGGSPGSTAGGVKTTTIFVLVLSVAQSILNRSTLEVFGRTIPERIRSRAAVVVSVAAFTFVCALVAIQLTQEMSGREAAFEVVSALGTVGLSVGATAKLDGVGKIIIILCMFIGRVGGVTLLMLLSNRTFVPKIRRPEEDIDVG